MAEWILGAMQAQIGHIQETLRDHGELLDEISEKLDRIQLKPPPKDRLDIVSILQHPRLWWGLLVAGLAGAQVPLDQAIKIVSFMR